MTIKLDVGGGLRKVAEDYLSVDIRNDDGVDVVCDIENQRLPFDDSSVDEIYTHHTLEHIGNLVFVMNEFFRVLHWGGTVTIIVPHFRSASAYSDPTHKRVFTPDSMRYFCGEYLKKYSLDYGIRTCFHQISVEEVVFADKEPEYLTEIHFVLEKNSNWVRQVDYDLLVNRIFNEEAIITPVQAIYDFTEEMRRIFKEKNDVYGNAFLDRTKYTDQEAVMQHLDRNMVRIRSNFEKHNGLHWDVNLENALYDLSVYSLMTMMRAKGAPK
jgi:predicted SAM-dependent methyltransferase